MCNNCSMKGEILYDEKLQYIINKNKNSGLIATILDQPNFLLDILGIDQMELKYLASETISDKTPIEVSRIG